MVENQGGFLQFWTCTNTKVSVLEGIEFRIDGIDGQHFFTVSILEVILGLEVMSWFWQRKVITMCNFVANASSFLLKQKGNACNNFRIANLNTIHVGYSINHHCHNLTA